MVRVLGEIEEKFTKSEAVRFDESKVAVASDGEADGADTRIEIKDFVG